MVFGLGLHILIAIFFAVHAVRSGQPMYWLFILLSFPLLGSLIYFLAIYLPSSRIEAGARKAVAATVRVLDPERNLREAHAAFEGTPTAQNQLRLAAALLDNGDAEMAAQSYENCLRGPLAKDPQIRLGAARACIECGRYTEALTHLEAIRAEHPKFSRNDVNLALACAYGGANRQGEAQILFAELHDEVGGFDVIAHYALWALDVGDFVKANSLLDEAEQIMRRWPKLARKLNAPLVRRLQQGFAAVAKK